MLFLKDSITNDFIKQSRYINTFPTPTDKYSTTAQTAKAIATQSFTAQKKTREESSLPRYTLLAGHPFSIKFVMQLQLQLIIRVK